MKHEDYKLIPFNDISEDARKIAVAWFEYKPMGFDLANRHKLASDIMNYSNAQLAQYKAKLKELFKSYLHESMGHPNDYTFSLIEIIRLIDDL